MRNHRPTDWLSKAYPPGHDTSLDHPGRPVKQLLSQSEIKEIVEYVRSFRSPRSAVAYLTRKINGDTSGKD